MTFDSAKTLQLIQGGLLSPNETWAGYLGEKPSLQTTATVLAGPLLLVYVLLAALFGLPGSGPVGGAGRVLLPLLSGLAGLVLLTVVVNLLAGVFGGVRDTGQAFAAVSLASIPGFLGGALGTVIPWIGFLISLAGGILSLVFLWRIIPLALNVPAPRRLGHFLLSLACVFVLNVLVGLMLSPLMLPGASLPSGSVSNGTRSSGMIGAMQRQAELMEQAERSQFAPPEDGRITRAQAEAYATVQRKTIAAQAAYREQLQELERSMDGEEPSLSQLTAIGSGITGMVGANNAELDIVVSGGGNWAEHLWVKDQIRVAMLHGGDGPGAIPENHALWAPYAESLARYVENPDES